MITFISVAIIASATIAEVFFRRRQHLADFDRACRIAVHSGRSFESVGLSGTRYYVRVNRVVHSR